MTSRKLSASIVIVGAAALLVSSSAPIAGAAGAAKRLAFYEKNSGFVYTSPSGAVTTDAQSVAPAPDSRIEFSDMDYSGSMNRHRGTWTASDHFVCVFGATGMPTCNGQLAIGNSMLIVEGTGGQGGFAIPIVSGTGAFLGYRGSLKISDIRNTLDANIEVVISKP
jgi:hypothetical protein